MAKISKIKPNDIANGQGINVSVWFQGCPHHCKGCFNPETWDFNGGEEFTEAHINKIFKYINKNNIKRNQNCNPQQSQTKNGGKSYGQFPISSRTDDSMDRKIPTPQRSYKYVIILEVST